MGFTDQQLDAKGADIDGKAAGDVSGISIDLSKDGNTVAVGAIGNDDNGGSSRPFKSTNGMKQQHMESPEG